LGTPLVEISRRVSRENRGQINNGRSVPDLSTTVGNTTNSEEMVLRQL
jgi:hypothetical protein